MAGQPQKLALHGGSPVKTTPFGKGTKHPVRELDAVRKLFERGSIPMTRGPEVMALREAFCRLTGQKYAVTASSGTAALHTAMGALEIGRGDEVITSPITDMGTLIAIMAQNAVPVFADVDPLTLMITPESVEARLSRHTRAVIVVHLAGQCVSGMRRIARMCKARKIPLVEDMAQSYLCRQDGRLGGTFGDIACWSLNESKHIGAGDGGVLTMNSRALARRADLFADKCYDREGGPVAPFFAPYNYRLNDLVAAVCLEQLKRVKSICTKRQVYGSRLDAELADIPGIIPRPVPRGDYATYWYYVLHVDEAVLGVDKAGFLQALRAEGVPASGTIYAVLDWPVFAQDVDNRHACGHHCPLYKGRVGKADYDSRNFPGLLKALRTCVRLSISEFYTASDVRDIVRAVRKVAHWYRANRAEA